MRGLFLLLGTALATSVGAAEPQPYVVQVSVRELSATDGWEVDFRLPGPVNALSFRRSRNEFRSERWKIQTPGVEWTRREQAEVLRGVDGAAFDRVTVRFATDLTNKPKDYNLHLAFSEGSHILYTGFFGATPRRCEADPCNLDSARALREGLTYAWDFVARGDRKVFSLMGQGRGRLAVTQTIEAVDRGAYVFFGDIDPVQTNRVTAFVDPGMPSWMVEATEEFLPRLFDYFAAETGIELDFKPLVYLSWGGDSGSGRTFKGGTLTGTVQLDAAGGGFLEASAKARRGWLGFLGHESFHLWNGQMFEKRFGQEGEWLSESSSDYFSFRALRDLGQMSEADLVDQVVSHTNRCLPRLRGRPLLVAHTTGDYKAFYHCGAMVQFLADRKIRGATGGKKDLADLFARMWDDAGHHPQKLYSRFTYMETFRDLVDEPLATRWIETFLHEGYGAGTSAWVKRQFDSVGIEVDLVEGGEGGPKLIRLRTGDAPEPGASHLAGAP